MTQRKKEKGQALVEFALTLPILLFFTFIILDAGRLLFTYAQASNSLRRAVRQAPVVGFGTETTPPYLDCNKMRDLADNVAFANVSVDILYRTHDGDFDCTTVTDGDLENGDLLIITSTATIRPLVAVAFIPDYTLNLNFVGQRTIVKIIQLGNTSGTDTDYDGLDDDWENTWFGNLNQSATDDFDGGGCNNGQEEAYGLDPTDPADDTSC